MSIIYYNIFQYIIDKPCRKKVHTIYKNLMIDTIIKYKNSFIVQLKCIYINNSIKRFFFSENLLGYKRAIDLCVVPTSIDFR